MLVHLQVELVVDGIRKPQRPGPHLMRPSVRVLLADARSGRGEGAGPGVPPGAGVRRGIYRRDGKQIFERIEDQRTGRKWLVADVTQREGRGRTQRPGADQRRAPREKPQLEQLSSVQSEWFSRSHLSFLLSFSLSIGVPCRDGPEGGDAALGPAASFTTVGEDSDSGTCRAPGASRPRGHQRRRQGSSA